MDGLIKLLKLLEAIGNNSEGIQIKIYGVKGSKSARRDSRKIPPAHWKTKEAISLSL